ncbi:alkene reductase [Phytoactinopolyspora endophytica]|uniref:alkene reductase n=1 Tax=Phytoactinopolyspora endophytica TaxID=1642495 RepID=UPI00101D139D|nr:alkene reductase [Phytoactinopolyspora endophytica]
MSTSLSTALGQPLLRSVTMGDLELPNRMVMAPATRARAANDQLVPTELHAAYYSQRASAGLIITEGTWISENAIGFINVPGIYSEDQVTEWSRVTDIVHAVGGRILLQLWHTGSVSHPDLRQGQLPAGPSAVNPCERVFTPAGFKETVVPREMTMADITHTITDYRTAAENARRAGFDGVEIQAVGSSLIPQFLNPRLNRRNDGYGTDRAGRRRLVLEIIDAVTAAWPGGHVGLRLSPYWTVRDVFNADDDMRSTYPYVADDEVLSDYDELVEELNRHALAYLHLRGPVLAGPDGTPDFSAFARYRRLFDGALIANHGFDRQSGNSIIDEDAADAVSFARHFIANPDLVTRFAMNRAMTTGDPQTYYGGESRGYVDYPVLSWSE